MELPERLRKGQIYLWADKEVDRAEKECLQKLFEINSFSPFEEEARNAAMREFFGSVGENLYLETPFHASWGKNIFWGSNCFANYNLTLVDDGEIHIGDNVMIGPNVTITATGHPINPKLRLMNAEFTVPVVIGNNVWLGTGCIVLPGVHIGDNSVIGAGSIVTKDIPANVVAVGNPCRVMREIGERDNKYYYKDKEIDIEF